MAVFQWKGIEGSKVTSGEIEARNSADASKKLQEQKIIATSIVLISGQEEGGGQSGQSVKTNLKAHGGQHFRAKKIKNRDLVIFTKKFATMAESGLPILKTLKMLESQQENPNFKKVVRSIAENVEGGMTLSEAFSGFPEVFDTVFINLIKAGETSGKLTLFLRRLVVQLEKSEKIRKKVKAALSYPIILLSVAFVVITIMMVKVVPVFQGMFANMGHDLPGPTMMVVNASEYIRDPQKGGVLLVTLIALFVISRFLVKKNMAVKSLADKYILKFPIIGDVIQKSTLSKIAMIQGNLTAAGVAVTESLDIISDTITNTIYKEALAKVKEGVLSGNSLSSLYSTCRIFPSTFHQMLAVGEETGNMEEMFSSTALYYEEEFDLAVERLTESLEPVMIVLMGLTVGFIIVAMYMPIFQMGQMTG